MMKPAEEKKPEVEVKAEPKPAAAVDIRVFESEGGGLRYEYTVTNLNTFSLIGLLESLKAILVAPKLGG